MIANHTYNRKQLIGHAQLILKSELKSIQIANLTGIDRHQIYHYRSEYRKIERAQLETLLKFNSIHL